MKLDRSVNLIALSIPAFFVLIGLELLLAKRRGLKVYRFNDSIADLSTGIINRLGSVLIALLVVAVYGGLEKSVGLFDIQLNSPLMWLLCFLGVDFLYYWFHRLSHQVNFLWAAHVVHHQSEEYNLAVALRQSLLQPAFGWVFNLPLALLGFPLEMFLTLSAINTLYQFWIHTRVIPKLGPVEWIFNTPSHHRVHHGQNPIYIDRNHGGTLIVWDRLFGTFQEEQEEVVYGVTEPLASWNPLWANLHSWVTTARRARTFPNRFDRLKIWFMRPGWVPPAMASEKAWSPAPKYDPQISNGMVGYVLAQFVLALVGTVLFLAIVKTAPLLWSLSLSFAILLTLTTLGGLLEERGWARTLEQLRLPAIAGGLLILFPGQLLGPPAAAIVAVALLSWLWLAMDRSRRFSSAK